MPQIPLHATPDRLVGSTNDGISFRGRRWHIPPIDSLAVDALIGAGADALTAPILAARGLHADALAAFMTPRLRDMMPDPDIFPDLATGAEHIAGRVAAGARLAIWSDYDVDGATAAAVLADYLRRLGAPEPMIHIPDRIAEGYGPNADGLRRVAAAGIDTVVILDSGTVAFEPLAAARAAGLDVVVVDHHAPEATLPPAKALINPNRTDAPRGYGHLCAAGMTFLVVVAINLRLRRMSHPAATAGVDLMALLDLVALGTVCDVVPLTGLNRTFLMLGLPQLSRRARPGIAALAQVARCSDDIDADACGYAIGPRLNAGGRIGPPDLATHCLLETDPDIALHHARELDRLNRERQDMERACTQAALAGIAPADRAHRTPGAPRAAVAVVHAHEGVVGISAARLKDALDTPAFVLAPTADGRLKGSGRSVPGFDLGAALHAARAAGLVDKAGGHAMAGGVTLDPDALAAFVAHLDAAIAASPFGREGLTEIADMTLPAGRLTLGLSDAIDCLGPFGMHHPRPTFHVRNLTVVDVTTFKDTHLRVHLAADGRRADMIEAVAFGAAQTALSDGLHASLDQPVDMLVSLSTRDTGRRRVRSLQIIDARPAVPDARGQSLLQDE